MGKCAFVSAYRRAIFYCSGCVACVTILYVWKMSGELPGMHSVIPNTPAPTNDHGRRLDTKKDDGENWERVTAMHRVTASVARTQSNQHGNSLQTTTPEDVLSGNLSKPAAGDLAQKMSKSAPRPRDSPLHHRIKAAAHSYIENLLKRELANKELALLQLAGNESTILSNRPRDVVPDALRARGDANVTAYITTAFWNVSNPHDISLLIDEAGFCRESSNLSVVIVVLSALTHDEERDRIRRGWGRLTHYKSHASRAVFLLGRSGNAISLMDKIRNESLSHRDIIQGDFEDTYRNLTLKSIMGLKWASDHCSRFQYMLKLDDDVDQVNLTNVFNYIESERNPISRASAEKGDPRPDLILCNDIKPPTRPIRLWSKWYASRDEYPDEWYPRYCNGCDGYLMSVPVASKLYRTSLQTRYFAMEDAYVTGILPLFAGNVTRLQYLKYL